ncbi:MAG TPA: cytosine permease [Rickettsiales bacterium]|nr:cytosine permease [Rickettsiales bacterium]
MKSDFEREPTPVECSVKWCSISLIYMGIAITLPLFYIIAEIALSLGFYRGIFALSLSVLFLSTLGSFTGYIGAKTRLSTYMISSIAFGKNVAKFINFLMSAVLLGWYAITLTFFGNSISTFLINEYNIYINTEILIIICGTLILTSAIFGFDGINKISAISVPLLLVLLYAMLINSLNIKNFIEITNYVGNNSISFGKSVSILIGSFICGVSILPDVSRYAKLPKDGVLGGIFGFIGGQFIVGVPCLIVGLTFLDINFVNNAIKFSPILAFIILILAIWTTNDNNLYSTSLSLSVIFERIKKVYITIILGILGIVLACLNIMNYFVPFLSLLGIIFPSIAIINIMDFFLRKKDFKVTNKMITNKKAIIAWICGVTVALLTYYKIITITTMSAIDGLIIAGLIYFALIKFFNINSRDVNK